MAVSGEDTATGSKLHVVGSDAATVTALTAAAAAAVVMSVVASLVGGVVEAAGAAVRWTPGTAANVCFSCVTSDMSTTACGALVPPTSAAAAAAAVSHRAGRPVATPRLELLVEALGVVVDVDGVSTAQ